MVKLWLLYLLWALPLLGTSSAAAQLLPIRNYTTREGLNGNSIYAVLRDSRGLLWVGTYNGVSWYDGSRFLQPAMNTPGGQIYVTNFMEDNEKNVWITSWYSGIYKYADGRFTNYLPDSAHIESSVNNTFALLELSRGHYVVATDRNVWLFDEFAGHHFTLLDSANASLDQQIGSLALTQKGDILIGYSQGVAWYQREQPGGHGSADSLLRPGDSRAGWAYAGMLWQDTEVNKILVRDDQCWLATAKGLYYYPRLSAARPAALHLSPSGPGLNPVAMPGQSSPLLLYPHAEVDNLFIDPDKNI